MTTLFRALRLGRPETFNTDGCSQFATASFTGCLEEHGVRIVMGGRGRCFDNIFIEPMWRTAEYEKIYLEDYADVPETHRKLGRYFRRYNQERLHRHLGYGRSAEVRFADVGIRRLDPAGGVYYSQLCRKRDGEERRLTLAWACSSEYGVS